MQKRDERLTGGRSLSAKANLSALSPPSRTAALSTRRHVKDRFRRVAEKILVAAGRQDRQVVLPDDQQEDMASAASMIWSSSAHRAKLREALHDANFDEEATDVMLSHFEASVQAQDARNAGFAAGKKARAAERRAMQRDMAMGRAGRVWSHAMMRMVLAVIARSPTAFRALKSFNYITLPAESTAEPYFKAVKQEAGISPVLLDLFVRSVTKLKQLDPDLCVSDVGLYFDEVKLVSKMGFGARGTLFLGAVSSAEEFSSLTDIFSEYTSNDEGQVTAAYAMVYAIRLLEQPSEHTVVCYLLADAPLVGGQVSTCLLEVLALVQAKQFIVRLIVCDGASTNIRAVKRLSDLGRGDITCEGTGPDPHAFEPRMANPWVPGEFIYFVVCR